MSLPIIPKTVDAKALVGERYKMAPIAVSCVEKYKNATCLPNIDLIAKQIRFPSGHIAYYLSLILNTKLMVIKGSNAIVLRGDFTQQKVQSALYTLISQWLVCEKCNLPELTVQVASNSRSIVKSCKACGHDQSIPCKKRQKKSVYTLEEEFTMYISENQPPMNKDDGNDMKLFQSMKSDNPLFQNF